MTTQEAAKGRNTAQAAAMESAHPSLRLYVVLVLLSVGLIALAFSLQTTPDWAGLLLNIAAGLVGSVVILVFVDRRLRRNELEALRQIPATARQSARALFSSVDTAASAYCRSVVSSADGAPVWLHFVYMPQYSDLETKSRSTFVLQAEPGAGKSTWTMFLAVTAARRYLAGEAGGRLVIVFRLARWVPDRGLRRSIFEQFCRSTPCSEWTFHRLLRRGLVVIVLDGWDEMQTGHAALELEHQELSQKYPKVGWVVTTRPVTPMPLTFGDVVPLFAPDPQDIAERRRRLGDQDIF